MHHTVTSVIKKEKAVYKNETVSLAGNHGLACLDAMATYGVQGKVKNIL